MGTVILYPVCYNPGKRHAEADLSGYADLNRVHSWALNAVEWAVAKGLISGTSETTLSPRNSATRAEIALIVKNYVETVKK